MSTKPTPQLATFAADLTYETLPATVRERVIDLLVDALASALAGRQGDETAQVTTLADALGGPRHSTVIAGTPHSLAGATLLNSYQTTAVTVCDIHRGLLCHTTPQVVAPALVMAEDRGRSGRNLVAAVAAGLEVTVRVGKGMVYPSMRARGWHSPGVIGPFGGAAAVGSLMGLSVGQFRNALSLAGTQSAGTFAHWGTPTIKFHQCRGALSALMAALLAEQDFVAAEECLSAEWGGLLSAYSDGGDADAITADLGERWHLEEISLRPWPAAGNLQSVVTALIALIESHGVRPDEIERVDVGMPPTGYRMYEAIGWDDKFHAMLSPRYMTAVVLHDRRCWLDQFTPERISDPVLDAFARERVTIVMDPSLGEAGATVTIATNDGRALIERREHPHGDAADPLSRDEVVDKFQQASDGLLASEAADRAIEMLNNLAELERVSDLCQVLGLPAAAKAV